MARLFLAVMTCAGLASAAGAQSPAPAATSPAPSSSPVPLPYVAASPDPARGAALIKKAVAAHGGAAAIDAIKSLHLKGSSGRILPGQPPVDMASQTHFVLPDLYRHELVTQAGPIATLLNREGAYVLLSGGALPLPEAEAVALRATANRNLVALLRARPAGAARVAHVGSAKLPDGDLEMVEFDLGGQKTVVGIDAKTSLVRQSVYAMPMGGNNSQVVATYSDYRTLSNGVKYPFHSQGTVDGKPVFTSRLESVTVNGAVDQSLFVPPAAPTEPLPWASPSPAGN